MSQKRGFNIKKANEEIELNLHVEQFTEWVKSLPKTSKGWVSLRLYQLEREDPRGFTHNMRQIIRNNGV